MNLPEEKRMLLSQLVDGELPATRPTGCWPRCSTSWSPCRPGPRRQRELNALVRLRRATEPWREQEPPRMVVAVAAEKSAGVASHAGWRAVSLASAVSSGRDYGGRRLLPRRPVRHRAAASADGPSSRWSSSRPNNAAKSPGRSPCTNQWPVRLVGTRPTMQRFRWLRPGQAKGRGRQWRSSCD